MYVYVYLHMHVHTWRCLKNWGGNIPSEFLGGSDLKHAQI